MTTHADRMEEARDMADLGPAYTKPSLEGVPLQVTRTQHWRTCPECQGAGSVTFNRSHNNDPQCDEDRPCPHPDCEEGEIVEWVDPLFKLRDARRSLLRHRRTPFFNLIYGERRQDVVTPVVLPDAPKAAPAWRAAA